MAAEQDHVRRAERNLAFYNSFALDTTPYRDWAVTALFYSALHYVDARLDAFNIHPDNHPERGQAVGEKLSRRLYRSYRELQEKSEDARYRLIDLDSKSIRDLETGDFAAIREFVRNRLNPS